MERKKKKLMNCKRGKRTKKREKSKSGQEWGKGLNGCKRERARTVYVYLKYIRFGSIVLIFRRLYTSRFCRYSFFKVDSLDVSNRFVKRVKRGATRDNLRQPALIVLNSTSKFSHTAYTSHIRTFFFYRSNEIETVNVCSSC